MIDTHVLFWYHFGDNKLGKKAQKLISNDDINLGISVVSFWEFQVLVQKKMIIVAPDICTWFDICIQSLAIEIVSLNLEIVKNLPDLAFNHSDPADHFIASTAHTLKVPLITADDKLLKLKWLRSINASR